MGGETGYSGLTMLDLPPVMARPYAPGNQAAPRYMPPGPGTGWPQPRGGHHRDQP
jgi:hypothetical protein